MLTSPSDTQVYNTQVYSPFGSYVVEQHGTGIDRFRAYPVHERPRAERAPAEQKDLLQDLPKAA